jgi:uncharacterized protein YutE (UPF0331/DUF86 family)
MIDIERIYTYFSEIDQQTQIINEILLTNDDQLLQNKVQLNALKYSIIVTAEVIGNTLQHILAKKYKIAIDGYQSLISKSTQQGILTDSLYQRLKPFFDFRNMLVHRYWKIDDSTFLINLRPGVKDLTEFKNVIQKCIGDSYNQESNNL